MSTQKIGSSDNIFGKALRDVRKSLQHTQAEFASQLSISSSYVSDIEKGKAKPSESVIREIVNAFGVNRKWLETGEGNLWVQSEPPKPINDNNERALAAKMEALAQKDFLEHCDDLLPENFVKIPFYPVETPDSQLIECKRIDDFLCFRAAWIQNVLGRSVRNLGLVTVNGDNMEPTLADGDVVMVDLTDQAPLKDSLYVLYYSGSLSVKRIQCMLDGTVAIKSDNKAYKMETLSVERVSHLLVFGRVVWYGRMV